MVGLPEFLNLEKNYTFTPRPIRFGEVVDHQHTRFPNFVFLASPYTRRDLSWPLLQDMNWGWVENRA